MSQLNRTMKESNYLFNPEDDMDFMPIIPLNENEGENGTDTVIPDELSLLPLRNTVLFPGVVLPITVGRTKVSRQSTTHTRLTNW